MSPTHNARRTAPIAATKGEYPFPIPSSGPGLGGFGQKIASGSHIVINLQPITAGESSQLILLMTNATASNDLGTITIVGQGAQNPALTGQVQLATDEPTN